MDTLTKAQWSAAASRLEHAAFVAHRLDLHPDDVSSEETATGWRVFVPRPIPDDVRDRIVRGWSDHHDALAAHGLTIEILHDEEERVKHALRIVDRPAPAAASLDAKAREAVRAFLRTAPRDINRIYLDIFGGLHWLQEQLTHDAAFPARFDAYLRALEANGDADVLLRALRTLQAPSKSETPAALRELAAGALAKARAAVMSDTPERARFALDTYVSAARAADMADMRQAMTDYLDRLDGRADNVVRTPDDRELEGVRHFLKDGETPPSLGAPCAAAVDIEARLDALAEMALDLGKLAVSVGDWPRAQRALMAWGQMKR